MFSKVNNNKTVNTSVSEIKYFFQPDIYEFARKNWELKVYRYNDKNKNLRNMRPSRQI